MSQVVILAEKPDQGRKLAAPFPSVKKEGYLEIKPCQVFPDGAKITWAIGHLVELKNPDEYKDEWKKWRFETLPIIPDHFSYKVSKGKAKQFKIVKELLKEADEIIIGTDPAREGENIARLLIMMAGAEKKSVKRLWTSSLTENAIMKGFTELYDGSKTIHLYHEAQARQISDWLVGLNASRLYTLHLQKKGIRDVFSVGRVQTPVLKLIYDRQKEIENFKPEPFFELQAAFEVSAGNYTGKLKGRFKSPEELFSAVGPEIVKGKTLYEATVKSAETAEKRVPPPKLHSLSTLQAKLNKQRKMSPSGVLKTAQSLYEKGYISYPRTDSQYITEEEFGYIKARIGQYQETLSLSCTPARLSPSKRFVDAKRVSDHYAIVPTEKRVTQAAYNSFSGEQKAVYEEVIKTALGMFMEDYVYDETTILTSIGKNDFISKGRTMKKPGWKTLYQKETDSPEEKADLQMLPKVAAGEPAKAEIGVKDGMTQPPKPYTQGQLITLMKTAGKHVEDKEMREALNSTEGLGTEATRSGIIDTLLMRKFIEVKKNEVFVTPKGEVLCEAVDGTLLSKPEMTAKWEVYLKGIGSGEKSKEVFIETAKKFCYTLISQAGESMEKLEVAIPPQQETRAAICACPACQKGSIMDRKTFYGCTEYKSGCKQTFPKKLLGKSISAAQIKTLCQKGKTNKLKGFKGKKPFDASLVLKDGKIGFSFE
ncbi:type IA DNA topoisomerase [Metabacillus indicus]|uniref:type IA DNA topoisomerase n=1 Tax=Metabacillus indicus TaxID=246786 RepID=UPI0004938987|nr:type IA DNA topoisomerase [Metabacillus indicus]KEZ47131.1 DNA topoisomerase III [Metabacillus indicus LMG 22858]